MKTIEGEQATNKQTRRVVVFEIVDFYFNFNFVFVVVVVADNNCPHNN